MPHAVCGGTEDDERTERMKLIHIADVHLLMQPEKELSISSDGI